MIFQDRAAADQRTRAEIAELNASIANQVKFIQEQEKIIAGLNIQVANQAKLIGEQERIIARLKTERGALLQAAQNAVSNSSGWPTTGGVEAKHQDTHQSQCHSSAIVYVKARSMIALRNQVYAMEAGK